MDIYKFWKDILEQNADMIKDYFDENAYINWHCTNEHFNVNEFIIANCEYPGDWDGEVERIEKINDLFITNVIKLSRTCQGLPAINQPCVGRIWGFCQLSEVL